MPRQITRRAVLHAAAVGLTGCGVRLGGPGESRLRLTARPSPAMARSLPTGTWTIRLDNGRVGLVHVPARDVRALVVALHGARGTARSGLDLLRAQADRLAFVILAPASAGSTWAVLRGGADPDTPA